MPYNEWGDQDPKLQALEDFYRAANSYDEWKYANMEDARDRYKAIKEAESYQGGT